MNTTTLNPSNEFVLRLKNEIDSINKTGRAVFIGITYTSKGTGETSKYVLNLGVSYLNAIRKDIAKLSLESNDNQSGLEIEARNDIINSLKNTLIKHEMGEKNDAYTKSNVYLDIIPGLKISLNDSTFELRAMVVSKKVIVSGIEKIVKSSPLTIAKNKIRENLYSSNYRSFCLDVGNLESVRIGGSELEVS